MNEVAEKEEKKDDVSLIFSPEEVEQMFNSGFLEKSQLIGSRLKKHRFPEKKIAYFMLNMALRFQDQEEPLVHSHLKDNLTLQLQAILQEDLDKADAQKAEQEKMNEEGTGDITEKSS